MYPILPFYVLRPFLVFVTGFLLLTGSVTFSEAATKTDIPKILLFNSYHEGYDWSDDENSGFRKTILKSFPQASIFTEFLDTKNFPNQDHFQIISELLESKYRGSQFDVIVVMDNAALDFIIKYRKSLFQNTPVVFCGINNFKHSMIAGQTDMTGIAEIQDSVGTLRMALEQHPATREVVVVHDYTVTGLAIRAELENGLGRINDVKVRFLEDMRLDQAIETLKNLPPDNLVLILSYAVEKGGRSFNQAEAARLISSASPVPVYAIHAAQLGHGVIGGKLLSGSSQGKKAGELAIQILKGASAGSIPVFTGYLSANMFDYAVLKKFRIAGNKLPPDSIIINKPSANYAVNKTAFWLIILFAATASIVVIAFYRNIRQRKSFEKSLQLSEAKFRQLFNNAGDAIFIVDSDGSILEANQAACERMGYSREEFLALPYKNVLTQEQAEQLAQQFEKVKLYRQLFFETIHMTRSNLAIPVEVGSTVIDFNGRPAFLNIARDISERKKAEEEIHLQTRLLEHEIADHRQTEQLLRTERNNLNAIFKSAPVGMALLNSEAQIISYNKIMSDMFHLNQGKIAKQRIGDILQCQNKHAEYMGCGNQATCLTCPINKSIGMALQEGHSVRGAEVKLELALIGQNRFLWLLFSVEPIVLNGEKHALISFENITEKKQLAENFRENEERLRLIIETSQAGIILISPDSRIEFANNRMAEMLGCSVAELVGSSYSDHLYPPERETGSMLLNRLIDGDIQQSHTERSYIRKDGSVFGGYIAARRLLGESGALKAIVSFITDINDLKVATDNLRAEKERLAVTLRSIGDGVITTDTEGRVALINQVAEKLTGWSQKEAFGKNIEVIFRIIHEGSRQNCQNPVNEALSTGKVVEMANHTILISRDGTEKAIADSAAPILNDDGSNIGVVLVFRDVSEKKHVEEELFKARKLESIGVLAGGIAHDFNNFLTAILGNISLARRLTSPNERLYEILQNAETASNRAKSLAQQLLTFSKGGTPIRKLSSIGKIIEDSASFVLRGSNVRCRLEIDKKLFPVEVDAGQMTQVFNNLIINADQAMPDGGQIRIVAENEPSASGSDKAHVRISISDQGCGIAAANLDRIFDPYFTTKKHGSGLGLATVYSIIRNHQGEITAESKGSEGTSFTIILPAVNINEIETEDEVQDAAHQGNGKMLIMDDESIICEVLANILAHFGYEVETCSNGVEVCEIYENARKNGSPFDAVILDLTIPGGVGGKEAISMLQRIDPDVRAIVSSGYANDPIMARCREYGFAATLSKPYNIAEIEEVLKNVFPGTNSTS